MGCCVLLRIYTYSQRQALLFRNTTHKQTHTDTDTGTHLQSDTRTPAQAHKQTHIYPSIHCLAPSTLERFLGCPRCQLQALAVSWSYGTKPLHSSMFQGSASLLSRVDAQRLALISGLESRGMLSGPQGLCSMGSLPQGVVYLVHVYLAPRCAHAWHWFMSTNVGMQSH